MWPAELTRFDELGNELGSTIPHEAIDRLNKIARDPDGGVTMVKCCRLGI